MRSIAKAVERLRQMPRLTKVLTESRGLINTTDLLVATAATVILAAGVGSAAISTMNDAKYGKAQPDAQAMGNAITQFYKDTGKWPGQAEQAATATGAAAKTALFLVTSYTSGTGATYLPNDGSVATGSTLTVTTASCANNSLEGFVGASITGSALVAGTNTKDVNDYLVRRPKDADYPNWRGPYLQEEIRTDPWDRSWVINLQPLYCAETITGSTAAGTSVVSGGSLGYAWLVSGGTNRTVTTSLKDARLDSTGDDAGANLGKLVKPGTNGGS